MLRPPGRSVAIAFGVALVAHLALAARGLRELWWHAGEWQQNLVWLALSLGIVALGRLILACLPPGPTGAHDARGLGETWAASLALGTLALAAAYVPVARRMIALAESGEGGAITRLLPFAIPVVAVAALALVRWITLPGAMVPRHAVERPEATPAGSLALAVVLAWLALALFTRAFVPALAWVALGILLERALLRARRAPIGRALFLCVVATVANPGGGAQADTSGLLDELGVAAALGAGAAYLVPWLRRADRRAGVLAALFLAAPLLRGWDPLALAGPVVLVAASRAPQRRFAAGAALGACAAFVLLGLVGHVWPARERPLAAEEIARIALDADLWGLAWPVLLAALVLGALVFRWRGGGWTAGTPAAIEPPRREAAAVAALVVLTGVALALPASPWGEREALVILFPACALLAGLLVLPPERD